MRAHRGTANGTYSLTVLIYEFKSTQEIIYLHITIVVFDATVTKFMEALAHITRVVINGRTYLAEEHSILYSFK